jgi:aryl-alcohol dehydrogenase-like predicted oxidoreductase
MYGDTEELVGKWFQRTGKRDEIFLASKFGIMMEGYQFKGINSSADYCRQQCEASLKRLNTDCIDLCTSFLDSILAELDPCWKFH